MGTLTEQRTELETAVLAAAKEYYRAWWVVSDANHGGGLDATADQGRALAAAETELLIAVGDLVEES